MTEQRLIEVRGLSRAYGRVQAVREVSFSLSRGEVLGLLGPNGAGKSTTMRMLCGTLAAAAGTVTVAGVDLAEQPRRAKSNIGYLPENPPLYPELTVDEYLNFVAKLHRTRDRQQALQRAKRACGLDDAGPRLIGNLSKGFQQRVGIAQAIVHEPAVVVLDEPTVGLDPKQIREIRALIRELGGAHSVLLSTHILPEVQSVCDRVLIMNEGRIVLDRPIAELSGTFAPENLRLRLKRPPAPQALAALTGVSAIQTLANDEFRIGSETMEATCETLVQESVRQDWGLLELTPERRSLEEVFIALTSVDAAGDPAAVGGGEAMA